MAWDQRISRKVFGNMAGARHNLRGIFDVCAARIGAGTPFGVSRSETAAKFQRDGFAPASPFDPSLIARIQKHFDAFIEDETASRPNANVKALRQGHVYSRIMVEPQRRVAEFRDLVTPEVLDVLRQYYGAPAIPVAVACWRNYHVPTDTADAMDVFSNHWHCDQRSSAVSKLFVCISDVTPNHGPLHIQSRTRTRELLGMGFVSRKRYGLPPEVLEAEGQVQRLIGAPGTAMFANTEQCFHRAGIPEKGLTRDMIEIKFMPSSRPMTPDWLATVREVL